MPQPWVTCTECMLLPHAMQPQPPVEVAPPKPAAKARASRAKKDGTTPVKKKTAGSRAVKRLPKSLTDKMPALVGDKDLAYEIPDGHLKHHTEGADNFWLPITSMPKELRAEGFVYLQTNSKLVARCRVKGIGFKDKRWTHEPAETTADAGPGAILQLHKDEWEYVSIDLGPEGEVPVRGYRYLIVSDDGSDPTPIAEAQPV